MSKISVTVLNRSINLNCKDGDEGKIIAIAEKLQHRMQALKQSLNASDMETLIIGSIIILDEMETANVQSGTLHTKASPPEETNLPIGTAQHLEKTVIALEKLAEKINGK